MNVLYIADPNSIHDLKWVNQLSQMGVSAFWLPRTQHYKANHSLIQIDTIRDFSIVRFPITIWQVIKLKRLLIKYKIDIIHIMYAEPNALWCNFRGFLSVPMFITCRGTDVLKTIPETFKKHTLINYLVAPLYKRAFLKADAITATSSKQILEVKKFTTNVIQVELIRTGVDFKSIQQPISEHSQTAQLIPYLLFPRYIKPLYNHEFALNAIALLPDTIKQKYKMVFVGKDAGDADYQKRLLAQMAEMPNVDFVFLHKQSQAAIIELYKKASAVIMTPLSDGSPVSALEAYACETPVILPPLPYDEDLFDSSFHHFPYWQAETLAETIVKVLAMGVKPYVGEHKRTLIDVKANMNKVYHQYQKILKLKHN
ncbi:glycosyltransferase family 4 protein [Cytophagales bacterium LB-30]|uniref:Glycosyltransferase family 4 protein n=1 Tax=Shiella aurantiaca TaxID=3058365 RepID=A0ABT8F3A5_9BACT|nr:glycosyltransferase family 4 protein [Shiella aurantiaca]MDN4164759.1 glycosyltransferase family 4 protein [Shiella aurantiaca]